MAERSGGYLGDFKAGGQVFCVFDSWNNATSGKDNVTTTGFVQGDISVYKNGSTTQRTSASGISVIGTDFDGHTGMNVFSIDLNDNTDAGFYAAGNEYFVILNSITIDGSAVNLYPCSFSIERSGGAIALLKGTNSLANIEDKIDIIDTNVDQIETAVITNAAGADVSADIATAQADLDITTGAAGALLDTTATSAQLVDDVWDEVLTGGTHNVNNSSGKRLRQLGGAIFSDGVAQSGAANSIQLAAGAVTLDDEFRRAKVILVGGTGQGQEAIITSSVASTDTLTTTPAWLVNPDATSEYEILPAQVHATIRNGGYDNGMVYFDSVNGNPGTEEGVNGTSTNPSNNMTDLYAIAATEMITTIDVRPGSAVVLPSDSSKKRFVGTAYTVDLNGQELGDSRFIGALLIFGTAINTAGQIPIFERCVFGNVTLPPSAGTECGYAGIVTLGSAGNFTMGNSAAVFGSQLTIDYGAALNASSVFVTNWLAGTVEIQNAGAGTGSYILEMSGNGDLVVNANCSATTTVSLAGSISRNADVAGITYSEDANVIAVLGAPVGDDISADIAAIPTASEIFTTQMTEAYAANGVAPTMAESLFAIHQMLMDFSIGGTSYTVKKLDSTTTAFVVTLDSATNPTGATR